MTCKRNRLNISSFVLPILLMVGCGSSDDDIDIPPANDTSIADSISLIDAQVIASEGGVFTSSDGQISIEILPDALSQDAVLSVVPATGLTNSTVNMASAGDAFSISFGADLTEPAMVSLVTDRAPEHPELAESAFVEEDVWVRADANFFRASDSTVLSQIDEDGIVQPIFRTLQAESGDGVDRGLNVFLNATFGNEDFFGGVVGLQDLLNNLSPTDAVAAGVQVDVSRVPADIVAVLTGDDFAAKQSALESSAVTRALLRADAVVGVRAFFDDENSDYASSVGLTCALCHTTVTPTEFELSAGQTTALPIGALALTGAPNTNMDAGAILSLTPFATSAGQDTIDFLQGFGAGRFDARALPDNPIDDGVLNPTSIPQIWNFVDLDEQNYTYNWDGFFGSDELPNNALASRDELVFDLVLHANGAFGTGSSSVPLAAAVTPSAELVDALVSAEDQTPGNDIDQQSLLDLQSWERSLTSPAPGAFDEALAEEGFRLFFGEAQCVACHFTAEFTGTIVTSAITLEPPQGGLAAGIKTPGLRGISGIAPYFHDDSAATLEEVVEVYSGRIVPELTADEIAAVSEYMRSL